jgi:AcrR family transcriptional regulator
VARTIVDRDGAPALTMRSLAAEAGCAVGLPYKVFTDRDALVAAVVAEEFARVRVGLKELVDQAGSRTVASNLIRWSKLLLGSPAVALAHGSDDASGLVDAVDAAASETGVVRAIEQSLVDYLRAEQELGRVDPDVDARAFAFLIAGAIHNLLVAGAPYPRPSTARLGAHLRAVARAIEG